MAVHMGEKANCRTRRRSLAGASRYPLLLTLLLSAAWFAAPLSGPRIGGVRIAELVLLPALLGAAHAAVRRGTPRIAFRHLLGLSAAAAGLAIGQYRGGGTVISVVRLLTLVATAAVPTLIILYLRPSRQAVSMLIWAFIAGVVISISYAQFGPGSTSGSAFGLTEHKNQLAATSVMALPLIGATASRARYKQWGRAVLILVVLAGLNLATSRSGLIATLLVIALLAARWLRARPGRGTAVILSLLTLVGLATFAGLSGSAVRDSNAANTGSIARMLGNSSTSNSDEDRTELLEGALSALDLKTAALGRGYTLERSPHNVLVETWVAGGLLGLGGLLLIFSSPIRYIWRCIGRHARSFDRLTFRLAVSLVGYSAVALFNVVVWVPYVWCVFGLFIAAVLLDAGQPSGAGNGTTYIPRFSGPSTNFGRSRRPSSGVSR